jgi:hypothetical protein
MHVGRIAARVGAPLAATAVIGALGVTSAFATNDWTPGSVSSSHYRTAISNIYGAHVDLGVYWKGNNVSINGEVKDTAKDGRTALVEVRYQVYYSGAWHTHYRYPAKAAGKSKQGIVYSERSRFPARSVVARACLSKNGKVVTCDPKWR